MSPHATLQVPARQAELAGPASVIEVLQIGLVRDDLRLGEGLAALALQLGANACEIAMVDPAAKMPLLHVCYPTAAPETGGLFDRLATDPLLQDVARPDRLLQVCGEDGMDGGGLTLAAPQRLAGAFRNRPDCLGYLMVARPGRAGAYPVAARAAMAALLPLLAAACSLRQSFADLHGVLDRSLFPDWPGPCGLVYVDTAARPVFINDRMRRVLAAADGLALRDTGLVADSWQETRALQHLLARACHASAAPTGGRTRMTVSRPSGQPAWDIEAFPVLRRDAYVTATGIAAAIRVIDPADPEQSARDAVLERRGLTPAEVRLACLLLDGARPKDVAIQTGLSLHTVRVQQRNLYRKLGITRHYELMERFIPALGSAGK